MFVIVISQGLLRICIYQVISIIILGDRSYAFNNTNYFAFFVMKNLVILSKFSIYVKCAI